MAAQRRFDPPITKRSFVETPDYNRIITKADSANMVIISGQCGVGKTWIAEQAFGSLCRREGQGIGIYRKFKCTTADVLEDEVVEFLADYGIVLPQQTKDATNWHILLHMMRKLNEMYPEHRKFFILDDTDAPDELLDVLDEICEKLNENEDATSRWKIIVTTTRTNLKPQKYSSIGKANFVTLDGFSQQDAEALYKLECEDDVDVEEIVRLVYNKLGRLPLALSVAMKDLVIDNQLEKPSDYVNKYIVRLEEKAKEMQNGNGSNDQSKSRIIAACKLSIERSISESPNAEFCKKMIVMLTFFNESDIPSELLKACAETLNPKQPILAADNVGQLMGRLTQRRLCTKRVDTDESEPVFMMHALIKEAMKTFMYDMEEEQKHGLLKNALVSLTRVMPRDGCSHNPRLIAYYSAHGQTMDKVVDVKLPTRDHCGPLQSLIMLLHCELLACIGYCLVAQQNGPAGASHFRKALSKYSMLVTGRRYDQLTETSRSEPETLAVLYDAGQKADIVCSNIYIEFIGQLPQFHVLTHTSLANMTHVKEDDLINRHLNEEKFKELAYDERVLRVERLAKVYIGELLGHIQFARSKICLHLDYNTESSDLYIQHAHSAQKVYDLILRDHKVYLLKSLITRRNLLRYDLRQAKTRAEAERLLGDWKDLERAGNADPIEDRAFECGLLKSIVHEDKYHRLRCKEGQLLSLGLLYKHSSPQDLSREDHFSQGIELLKQITKLIKGEEESYNHRDMSMAYKFFARFMRHCSYYKSAVKYVICAMEELRLSGSNSLDPLHMAFGSLYEDLESYYNTYKERSPGAWLLKEDEPEVTCLRNIIAAINPSECSHNPIENVHMDFLRQLYSEGVQSSAVEQESVLED